MTRVIYGHPDYGAAFLKIEDLPCPLSAAVDINAVPEAQREYLPRPSVWLRLWRMVWGDGR